MAGTRRPCRRKFPPMNRKVYHKITTTKKLKSTRILRIGIFVQIGLKEKIFEFRADTVCRRQGGTVTGVRKYHFWNFSAKNKFYPENKFSASIYFIYFNICTFGRYIFFELSVLYVLCLFITTSPV